MSIISFGWLCRKFCSRKKPMQHPLRSSSLGCNTTAVVNCFRQGIFSKPWKPGGKNTLPWHICIKPHQRDRPLASIAGNALIHHSVFQQNAYHEKLQWPPRHMRIRKCLLSLPNRCEARHLALLIHRWISKSDSVRGLYRNCLHEQTTQNLSSQNFFIKRGSMKFDVNVTACDGKGARYRSESTLTKANHVATTPWYQMVPCSKHLEPSSCGTRLVLMDHSGSRAKNRKLTQSKSHATLIAIRWRVWKLVLRKKLVCRYI